VLDSGLRWLPVLAPLSRVRLAWDFAVAVAAVANLVVMPLVWAFPEVFPKSGPRVGWSTFPVFVLHVAVNMRTAIPQDGILVHDTRALIHSYLASYKFVVHLLAALAYPLRALTTPHLTPIFLCCLQHVLDSTLKLERATKAPPIQRRVAVLCLLSCSQIHWMACIWSLLADSDETLRGMRGLPLDAPSEALPMSWFDLYTSGQHAPPNATTGIIYLYSVYWTLTTTTTIGFGDVLPANELEVFVMCFTIAFSALLYSSLIAFLSNLILASDVNRTAHKQKVETIKSYMRHRKIPESLQARIEEYLDYLWTTQKGLDETAITSMLPATLRQQLSLHCNSRIISTVPLFKGVPPHVCAAIVMQLQPRVFVPEDSIIRRGEWADEMFLVYRGLVQLVELSEKEGRAMYLKDGDYFGEIAVLTGGRRMMSISAVTYCHLYSLQQKLLERILQQHPECIDNMLVNMMDAYENFSEIRSQIFSIAANDKQP